MKTLVVIPTYNERENIEMILMRILNLGVPDLHVLVVDDASPDGTGHFVDAFSCANPGVVQVIHRTEKSGIGSAYLAGFRYGIDHGFEVMCEMDADGSHDPGTLPSLIEKISSDSADVVIGSRRVRGGEIVGWGPHRHMMSHAAMLFARLALGLQTRDVTSGFRCYRTSVVKQLLHRTIRSNGYAFQEETVFYCEKLGFRIQEVPIVFKDRTKGNSKLSWKDIFEFFATIQRLRKSNRQE